MIIYPCCPLSGVEMGSLYWVVYMLLRPKMLDGGVIVVVGTIVFKKTAYQSFRDCPWGEHIPSLGTF